MFDEDEEGIVREVFSDYPYLLMLMKIWTGDWNIQLEITNNKLEKENEKSVGMVNGRAHNF